MHFFRTTNAYVREAIDEVKRLTDKGELGDKYPFLAYLLARTEISIPDIIQTIQSLLSDGLTSVSPKVCPFSMDWEKGQFTAGRFEGKAHILLSTF